MATAISKDAGNSSCAAVIHRRQLLSSHPELGCRQEQHDGLDTHDSVRQFREMELVNVTPLLLRQSLVTALNPPFHPRHHQ